MALILANMVVLAAQYYDQPDDYAEGLRVLNVIFTWVFLCELLYKLIGLGLKQYLKDGWNRLDGTIVVADLVSTVAGAGAGVSLLRTLRVLRVVRLIKGVRGLRSLATTLYLSIPSLGNVGIMLGLIMYVYAVLGMNLFYGVKRQGSIDATYNFESFGPSILTLTRVLTFDGWRNIMNDLMVSEPDCTSGNDGDCGSWMAVPFCFSLIILGNFLMLNIFTAVILRNFKDAAMDEGLAGEGFMSSSMFKMNQLDAYLAEFQRRYRVYRRRTEKPIWLYSTWDHSANPAYCPVCGTIPCMAQSYDPVLEIMVTPHAAKQLSAESAAARADTSCLTCETSTEEAQQVAGSGSGMGRDEVHLMTGAARPPVLSTSLRVDAVAWAGTLASPSSPNLRLRAPPTSPNPRLGTANRRSN